LVSTIMWIEKALNRGELRNRLINFDAFKHLCKYQKIENYISEETEIEYHGDLYSVLINSPKPPVIQEIEGEIYIVPKIMYVSAERNFLSAIESAFNVTGLPDHLADFAEEFKRAQIELKGAKVELPIGNYFYDYDEFHDISQISGPDYKINLNEASSGLQSLVPLYLVSENLSNSITKSDDNNDANISVNQRIKRNDEIARITLDNSISDEERKKQVSMVQARFINRCFINIVEEPEQNLFPTSQGILLNKLVEFNNKSVGNKLIMTTHSPYIINYLTLAVEAKNLLNKLELVGRDDLKAKVYEIVPEHSIINPGDLVVYELDEKDGSIKLLGDYKGLPSDENLLNEQLGEGNESFSKLLEIEDLCK